MWHFSLCAQFAVLGTAGCRCGFKVLLELTAGLVVMSIALTPDLRDRDTYQALRAPS
jgi:hypothetical protein